MSTYLYEQLSPEVGIPGTQISLSTVLTDAFGSNWGGYTQFALAYYGAGALSAWDFSYWNPNNPSISEWLNGGTAIRASTTGSFNQKVVTPANVANYTLQLGNEIAPYVFITVPDGSDTYIQYEINVVAPGLQVAPSGIDGEPTPADIVASAKRYEAVYGGTLNPNDCGFIASDLSAAAGAPLDDFESESLDPTQNNSAGFWRVVYRGSDPNPVSDWQTLVQPGDIVRMGWIGGGMHTTTVLSVNPNGSITVFDNDDSTNGGPTFLGIHTVNYDTETIPTTITIFRLTTDHLYLIDGSAGGQILNGTLQYDNEIITSGETQTVNCGPLNDVVDITAASTGTMTINGGGGDDTVVFTSLGVESAQIDGSNGQSLSVANGVIYDLSGSAVTVSWSGGSDTLNAISFIQFTDASLTIETANYPENAGNNDEWILSNGNWAASAGPGAHPYGYNVAGIGNWTGGGTDGILWFNPTTGDTDEWQLANTQWSSSVDLGSHPGNYQISGIGDFNGDGISDVLWTGASGGSIQTDIWELGSNGAWADSVSPGTHPAGYTVAGTGDWTGNGTDGILWYDASTGDTDEWQLSGGQWSASVDLGSHPGNYQISGIGDFFDNGRDDVLWTGVNADGTVATDIRELGSNGQWIDSVSPGSHPAGYSVVGVGDFTGTGTSDILWYDASTGDTDEWLIKNGQWAGSIDLGTHPGNFQIAGVGDFNGDGTKDILWHSPS